MLLRTGPGDPPRLAEGWVIGSDQPHWMNATAPVVTVFYDPLSACAERWTTRLAGQAAASLKPKDCITIRRRLEECWARGWKSDELQALAHELAMTLAPPPPSPAVVDERVRKVIDKLVSAPDEGTSVDDLAAEVGLSESRLEHLFRDQVGIPVRQYRLTLRMQEAAAAVAQGQSLTEAAYRAGFADSSHFCRICRRMFGVAPSGLPMRKRGGGTTG